MHRDPIEDPEGFWDQQARKLDWHKTWDHVLEWQEPYGRWFVGGTLNACYQCVDRKRSILWIRFPRRGAARSCAEFLRPLPRDKIWANWRPWRTRLPSKRYVMLWRVSGTMLRHPPA